jgi:hypothetical protein
VTVVDRGNWVGEFGRLPARLLNGFAIQTLATTAGNGYLAVTVVQPFRYQEHHRKGVVRYGKL